MTPTQLDLAWAAGFFDGEGCVHISFQRTTDVHRLGSFRLSADVCGRNRAAIDKYAALFGGNVRVYYNRRFPDAPYYGWRLDALKAVAFLEQVLPYLVNKHEISELGIEFGRWYAATTPRTRRMSPERRQTAMVYHLKCAELVRRHRQPRPVHKPQGNSNVSPQFREGVAAVAGGGS